MNSPTVENRTYYLNRKRFEDFSNPSRVFQDHCQIACLINSTSEIELSNLGIFVPAVNLFRACNLFQILRTKSIIWKNNFLQVLGNWKVFLQSWSRVSKVINLIAEYRYVEICFEFFFRNVSCAFLRSFSSKECIFTFYKICFVFLLKPSKSHHKII